MPLRAAEKKSTGTSSNTTEIARGWKKEVGWGVEE